MKSYYFSRMQVDRTEGSCRDCEFFDESLTSETCDPCLRGTKNNFVPAPPPKRRDLLQGVTRGLLSVGCALTLLGFAIWLTSCGQSSLEDVGIMSLGGPPPGDTVCNYDTVDNHQISYCTVSPGLLLPRDTVLLTGAE